eukprot:TRINITY_DN25315_c0_g2_i2.p1 TRINITY_DN25315_c0_g2~~TRINITY_DN25315_c0_g2_i2.p1  ORF type:complete len:141 (+),score=26.26 TRINITY_DN25315_c0_g2_i2:941-1363(+)
MKGTDSGFGLRITYGSLLGVELEGTKGGGYVAGIGVTNGEGSGVELEGTNEGGCGVELGTTCEEVWGLALAVTDGGGWGEWLGFANGEGLGVWTAGGTCPIPSSSFSLLKFSYDPLLIHSSKLKFSSLAEQAAENFTHWC